MEREMRYYRLKSIDGAVKYVESVRPPDHMFVFYDDLGRHLVDRIEECSHAAHEANMHGDGPAG